MPTDADRAILQQELAVLEDSLATKLATPCLPNDAARAKRAQWVQRTLVEIERIERELGIQHLTLVAL